MAVHGHGCLKDGTTSMTCEISLPGNRSDVRALTLSDDDAHIISCGNGGTKVWDASSGECLNSIPGSYGLSVMFAPGSKFAVVGCKSGKLDLISLGAAEVVRQIEAHAKQVCVPGPEHGTCASMARGQLFLPTSRIMACCVAVLVARPAPCLVQGWILQLSGFTRCPAGLES